MSLLGSNMAPGVRSELCRRSKIIPEGYGPWTHARMPWARFTPCVRGPGGEFTRLKHVLFSGNLKNFDQSYSIQKSGFRNTPKPGIKSVKCEEKGTLGGIKKVTVEISLWSKQDLDDYQYSLFALGKHAIVEWGWNIDSKGGVVSANLGAQKSGGKLVAEQTDSRFGCEARNKQSRHNFSYDVVRGIINNFNWKINDVGGFDATVTLTSKGTTFLSTPTETATMHSGCNEDPDDEKSEVDKVHRPNMEQPLFFLRQNLRTTHGNNDPYKNPEGGKPIGLAALFDKELGAMDYVASLFQDLIGGGPTNEELDFFITWDYFEEYIVNRKLAPMYAALNSKGNIGMETGTSQPAKDVCASGGASNNPQMFKQAFDDAKAGMDMHPRGTSSVYMLDSRGTVIRNNSFLISADPGKVMLPFQEHWKLHTSSITALGQFGAWLDGVLAYGKEYAVSLIGSIEIDASWDSPIPEISMNHTQAKKDAEKAKEKAQKEALKEAQTESNVDAATSSTLEKFKPFDHKYKSISGNNGPGSSGFGLLSNMLINVAFIEEVCNEAKSLDEFLDTILEGVTQACGDIWDLTIVEDPDNPHICRIIDNNLVKHSDKVQGFHFNGIGKKSICRTLDLETDIDSRMAAMMMYGSNKNTAVSGPKMGQPMGGASSNEYRLFNSVMEDIVMDGIALPDSTDQTKGADCCQDTVGTDANVIADAWAGYYKSAEEIADEVNEDSTEGMVTAMRKLLSLADPKQGLPTKEDSKVFAMTDTDSIIAVPLKCNMTLDGISGLRWGNYFGFSTTTAIPNRYQSRKGEGCSFQIVGIDHSITPNDWTTTVRAIMRPGPCIGTGINDCGTDQGLLPSGIMPDTETILFDLTPIVPPPTKKEVEERKEEDEFELIKLDTLPIKPIPVETNVDIEKAKCPCEDGSHHEDCCVQPSPSDGPDPVPSVIPNVPVDQDQVDEDEACQCSDGSYKKDCCPDETGDEPTAQQAACEDPVPVQEPGTVTQIEQKVSDEPDIVIEDTVEEEDCVGWQKRGSIIAAGNIKYRNSMVFEDIWYYEFRAHQEHCFFIDLYMWHGVDASGAAGVSKPVFSSMVPPSQTTTMNLFGIQNIFTAASLNRRATREAAAAQIQRVVPGRRALKDIKKKIDNKYLGSNRNHYPYNYKFMGGYNRNVNIIGDDNYGAPDVLQPGNPWSSGLWITQQLNWFRDDQPFKVNQPFYEGGGGPEAYDDWRNKGKSGWASRPGAGSMEWISTDPSENETVRALCKYWLKKMTQHYSGPIFEQARRNHIQFANGSHFAVPYRSSLGYHNVKFSPELFAPGARKPFGFAPELDMTELREAVYPINEQGERLGKTEIGDIEGWDKNLRGSQNISGYRFKKDYNWGKLGLHGHPGRCIVTDDMGNKHEVNPFSTRTY